MPQPPRPTNGLASLPLALLFAAALADAVGCDSRPRRVPISGTVLIDGEPVPYGNISFVPGDGRAASGKIDPQGRFELTCYEPGDGAILGEHRVTVAARQMKDGKLVWHAPKKYADFRTSGLTYTVTEPDDSVVIELTRDGEQGPSE
ncbi:hypothetical protein [Botrimarina sp.]|uniref:hypothetical protein n=1 Tax=Botrimarina sp. TaxID=2795802 RepID=UPI0032ECF5EB